MTSAAPVGVGAHLTGPGADRGQSGAGPARLDWLLDRMAAQVPGIRHALVVSADGLPLCTSPGLAPGHSECLAAVACGLGSLATGGAELFGLGGLRHTLVEMDDAILIMVSVPGGSWLGALAAPSCDIGLLGYELTCLAEQVGHAVTPAARRPA